MVKIEYLSLFTTVQQNELLISAVYKHFVTLIAY